MAVRAQPWRDIASVPTRSAPATVVSSNDTQLSAEVAARVVSFPPRVGDIVAAGDVIARLDCRAYELELASARTAREVLQARRTLAERRLARARDLAARQALAVEVLDEREAERAVLEAELAGAAARIERAAVDVGHCTVKSPFRALVRARLAPLGQYAKVGDAVARVVDVDDLELSAAVQVDDVAAVTARSGLVFSSAGTDYPVRLRTAVAAIDAETRNQELRFLFVAAVPLPGAVGQLVWQDPRAHVPGLVLVKRGNEFGVFVVEDGTARFVPAPAAQAGRASPLALDDAALVVTEGHYALRDGQRVELLAD